MIKSEVILTHFMNGNELTLCLHGEIDHHVAASIREEADGLIYRYRPQNIVFDLSKIEFMDSSGLGLIMGRYALAKKLGGTVSVLNPSIRVEKIFSLAGIERIIKIERSNLK